MKNRIRLDAFINTPWIQVYNHTLHSASIIDSRQWRSQREGLGFQTPSIEKGVHFLMLLVIEQKQWLIIKIVATRCRILRLKCTKFNFGWGSAADPAGRAHSAPPDPLAGFKGSYF